MPSYVKDTTKFLLKLDAIKSVPSNVYLVSLDVKSLNTSISNAEGIKTVKESFGKHTSKNVVAWVITTFLVLILTLNNFAFSCKHYLQIKGCAMDMICTPSYANMDHFENKYVYPFFQGFSLIYLLFIDVVFFIWTGTKEQLTNCLNNLSKKHNSIKFEYKISQTSITFLDTEVSIQNNKLAT